jgi:hypothetical protein
MVLTWKTDKSDTVLMSAKCVRCKRTYAVETEPFSKLSISKNIMRKISGGHNEPVRRLLVKLPK